MLAGGNSFEVVNDVGLVWLANWSSVCSLALHLTKMSVVIIKTVTVTIKRIERRIVEITASVYPELYASDKKVPNIDRVC